VADRQQLLEKLVVIGHVSVAERHKLGFVTKTEILELVRKQLLTHGMFPISSDSKAVYEGARLIQSPPGVQIIWERAYPWDPFTVAERRAETFAEVDAAIQRFIESEWSSGIDGITLS
jgi:hypothetical protein